MNVLFRFNGLIIILLNLYFFVIIKFFNSKKGYMINTSPHTYYDILGVPPTAEEAEIRAAYREQALICHPDKGRVNGLPTELATALFKSLQEANAVLSNPEKRKLYDYKIRREKAFQASQMWEKTFKSSQKNVFKRSTYCDKATCPPFSPPLNSHELDYSKIFSFKKTANRTIREILDKDDDMALARFVQDTNCAHEILKCMLYEACLRGKFRVVKYLIEVRKLDARMEVINGESNFTGPIFKAAAESGNLDLVKYLFEKKGADIESKCSTDPERSDTALMRAAKRGHEDVVSYLILNKADVNPGAGNLLYLAIASGKLTVVKLVVEAGTRKDPMCVDKALRQGSEEIVKYFLNNQRLTAYNYDAPPLCLASSSGNIELVKYLENKYGIKIPQRMNDREIVLVVKSCSIEMMNFLMDERGVFIQPHQLELIINTVIENLSEVIQQETNALPIVTLEKPKISPIEEADLKAFQLIQFLIEKKKLPISKKYLNNFCKGERRWEMRTYSYLRSLSK